MYPLMCVKIRKKKKITKQKEDATREKTRLDKPTPSSNEI